jgi:hypothetical protein
MSIAVTGLSFGGTTYVDGNATRTAINNDCGGSSPYSGGANATDGAWATIFDPSNTILYMGACSESLFPNNSTQRTTVNNVARLSGGVMTFGSFYLGIPGAYASDTAPTTGTLPFE